MRASPLPVRAALPGPAVLGFVACGVVVRRSAFLEAGGFHGRFGIGGEEELLALDLAAAGWGLAYADDVVAHHHPAVSRDPARRRRVQVRNALWTSWLRHPAADALGGTGRACLAALRDPAARAGLAEAARGLHWVLAERRPVGAELAADLRLLRRAG
jgi:GT2 family glycosyltransferase